MTVQIESKNPTYHGIIVRKAAVDVALLDYRRELKRLADAGNTQTEISRALHISQPSVSSALKTACAVPDVASGFSGAGPYEFCQRYAIGQIDRERLVDELARWEYAPIPEPDWLEDIVPSPGPGSWREVEEAAGNGLIDGELYETSLHASIDHHPRRRASPTA